MGYVNTIHVAQANIFKDSASSDLELCFATLSQRLLPVDVDPKVRNVKTCQISMVVEFGN